jgi:branched-chain amino acid transport system ATP-binding protein
VLNVDDLHVHYGHVHALRGVTLEVPDGAIVALLGANGAGKTTTLRAISGIHRPSRGRIRFDGEDISRLDASAIVRRGIIHCPEGRQVFPGLTVRENLVLGSYVRGNWRRQFDSVLDMFPALKSRLGQSAGTLSGGEQQMLAIGRALMGEPRLLLLDEPSLGLAPLIVEYIFRTIAKFRERDISVLLIEQNATLALEFASWAYALWHGEIRLSQPADRLLRSDLVQRAYLG